LYVFRILTQQADAVTYKNYRHHVALALLLGLEILVAADVIRTVALEPTLENVLILARIIHEGVGRNGSSLLRSEVNKTFGPSAKERADGRVYCTAGAEFPSDPPDK
jgi:hypothetical protein